MFTVKHIWGNGNELLLEAKQVTYYPSGGSGLSDHDWEAQVVVMLADGDNYIAVYGDVFVMQNGKTVQRYTLGLIEEWRKRHADDTAGGTIIERKKCGVVPVIPADSFKMEMPDDAALVISEVAHDVTLTPRAI